MNQTLPVTTTVSNPHYQLLGADTAIKRLVERFYQLMDELPEAESIRAMHPVDLTHSKERLFLFLSGWLGGPPLYTERFGPPRLRRAHAEFAINEDARDAWMRCMTQALNEQVTDAELKTQLIAAFFKIADFLRNQNSEG